MHSKNFLSRVQGIRVVLQSQKKGTALLPYQQGCVSRYMEFL